MKKTAGKPKLTKRIQVTMTPEQYDAFQHICYILREDMTDVMRDYAIAHIEQNKAILDQVA